MSVGTAEFGKREEKCMRRHVVGAGTVSLALILVASPVLAQIQTDQRSEPSGMPTVEVTSFVSMGSAASSRIGAAVDFPVTSNFSVEAELGYRQGEGDINALGSSINAIYTLPRFGRITPYIAAGAGLEEHGVPFVRPGGSEILTQSKLAFTLNAGGGVQVPVDDRWSLRTDARWFTSPFRNATDHWRVYQGVSFGVRPGP
jgi:hypothetical protein